MHIITYAYIYIYIYLKSRGNPILYIMLLKHITLHNFTIVKI